MEGNIEFNESEALKVIGSALEVSKRSINENGFIFLLWGWAVLIGNVVSHFWMVKSNGLAIGITWLIVCIIGGVISVVYYNKKEKKQEIRTHINSIISYVWAGIGLGGGLFYGALIITKQFNLIGPFMLIAAGIGTFITGRIIKFTPLIVGGIVFWLFALAIFLAGNYWQFILGAAAVVPGYLIPGYMLRSSSKSL